MTAGALGDTAALLTCGACASAARPINRSEQIASANLLGNRDLISPPTARPRLKHGSGGGKMPRIVFTLTGLDDLLGPFPQAYRGQDAGRIGTGINSYPAIPKEWPLGRRVAVHDH